MNQITEGSNELQDLGTGAERCAGWL